MSISFIQTPVGDLQLTVQDQAITELKFTDSLTSTEFELSPFEKDVHTQLNAYLKNELKEFALPVNPKGTEFQKKVWTLLQQIPFGKTMSYQELALIYGDVLAIRAIAAANGKNPIAIIIPCHRVIGKNGSLTGYAGGLERKKWLLELESNELRLF
jgi:methylated-DNA-[protein]-cysteine S-methyltransferase